MMCLPDQLFGMVAPANLPVKSPEAISAESTHKRADTYVGD